MKQTIPLFFFLLALIVNGQIETGIRYYSDKYGYKQVKKGAYKKELKRKNDSVISEVFSKTKSGQPVWEKYYLGKQPYGIWKWYDKKGNVRSTRNYDFVLKYGKYIPEQAIDKSGRPLDSFTPSNLETIQTHFLNNFRYPEVAQKSGTQGRVEIQFTVNKEGEIGNLSIINGKDVHLDTECFRLMHSLQKLEPYVENGESKMAYYIYGLTFKLQ